MRQVRTPPKVKPAVVCEERTYRSKPDNKIENKMGDKGQPCLIPREVLKAADNY